MRDNAVLGDGKQITFAPTQVENLLYLKTLSTGNLTHSGFINSLLGTTLHAATCHHSPRKAPHPRSSLTCDDEQCTRHASRCLRSGAKHDLAVVFRLTQLWFQLSTEVGVNSQMAAAVQQIPSRKFLPLAYQIASRLAGSEGGQLSDAGFQVPAATICWTLSPDYK